MEIFWVLVCRFSQAQKTPVLPQRLRLYSK